MLSTHELMGTDKETRCHQWSHTPPRANVLYTAQFMWGNRRRASLIEPGSIDFGLYKLLSTPYPIISVSHNIFYAHFFFMFNNHNFLPVLFTVAITVLILVKYGFRLNIEYV